MKNIRNLLLLAVSALSPLNAFAGNWADKWFDNAVYDSPSSFDSQKRGYYTMGGFTARTTTSTDYPITISPPVVVLMVFWEASPFLTQIIWLRKRNVRCRQRHMWPLIWR